MKRAIIIDDVENARIGLRQDLEDYCPEVEVAGMADGVVSGARMIRALKPDVVFLDIHMKDGTGFDLLDIAEPLDFALIFTTSSDTHAIQAFRFSAIDYLLKPIDIVQLQEAVAKVTAPSSHSLELLKSNLEGKVERLALNSQDRVDVVVISDIIRLQSHGSYTVFNMKDKSEIVVTKTLKEFDEMLRDKGFIRVHQSHLVNLAYIKSFLKNDGGSLLLKDGSTVDVSSRKRSEVMKSLGL